jgi:uncharacterized protein (DUF169 family)
MIESGTLLDDVAFCKAMLEKESLERTDIVFILRNLLRMKYYPVAVKYFFSTKELNKFKKGTTYKIPVKRYTFCHHVAASRQRGEVSLCTEEKLGCKNAQYVLGWKELEDEDITFHLKYAKDRDQALRFIKTKQKLPKGLKAFATGPLHKVSYEPDCIHGISDVLQSYHLANDWCAAMDTHPFTMKAIMNSSICHGCVDTYITKKPNITLMCGGSYKSGKTEQGEINWIWPWAQLEPTVRWMLERTVRDGGVSYPCTGETYPGFNMCKLCPSLIWMKPKK